MAAFNLAQKTTRIKQTAHGKLSKAPFRIYSVKELVLDSD
jgi:hypothetical protein